ncbi:MAG TPA: DUF3016 domain-containing protein [Arenimonas sp.]|nr:DUF3016 domain-containing protein [Arenimonas sp.]
MKNASFPSALLLAAAAFSSTASAGEAAVTWQNPEKYTDIQSDDEAQPEFQAKLFAELEKEFSKQAGSLPEGSKLAVTVTDFDLAGQMRDANNKDLMRVVIGNYFPQMTLDYTLTDAAGAVLSQQQGVVYKDQGFYDADASLRASRSSSDFYFETTMIRGWFSGLKRQLKKK